MSKKDNKAILALRGETRLARPVAAPSQERNCSITDRTMKPNMSDDEVDLLRNFLVCSDRYLEFGSGGSTCLAASLVKTSVTAIDSSQQWVDSVAQACAAHADWLQPTLIYVDIGPIGDWGWPTDPQTRPRWPAYHARIWAHPDTAKTDFILIDGRFRVASFMQSMLRCLPDAFIAMHDFRSRPHLHVVEEVARLVARAGELSVFQRRRNCDETKIRTILESHLYDAS
ncbi:hypothetical protein [Limobrevibacterium gyesilva]|uniref:Uncharacterized protein n=1 Tax=Limobrevibacterium gyesilva TaxID=2991712 RepID=A0AA41YN45_9PROT|nr:hypothetical protein [Limobrevibacterium gyesilva]MCW3476559.1 hypothetical protein [Limobrevibacterium gyesilva]